MTDELQVLEGLKPILHVQFNDGDKPADLTGAQEICSWWCQDRGLTRAASQAVETTDLKNGVVGVVPDLEVERGEISWFTLVRRFDKKGDIHEWCSMGFVKVVGADEINDGLSTDYRERMFPPVHPQQPAPEGGYGPLKAVIMGWPRSGTTWMMSLLSRLGTRCSHEGYLKFGPQCEVPSPPPSLEVTGFAAPFTESLGDIRRCLVVRHPAKLIGSIVGRWGKFMRGPLVPWLSDRWVEHMKHLREEAEFVVRIEDLWANPEKLVEIVERLGIKVPMENNPIAAVDAVSTKAKIDEREISKEVWELAREFGYET